MAGDNLLDILSAIRADLPEIPDDQWEKFKRLLCTHAGGVRVYVPANKKRSHFETLDKLSADADAQQIAKVLGISVRRVQQLKRLR